MSLPPHLPPLRLTGAKVLCDGALQDRCVALAGGRITDDPLPAVDLSGYLVLPGIIDLHGDGFERHIAPRPSAPFPMATGLATTDREAAAHGVTTAWLAQGWSWEGGHRSPDTAEALMAALADYRPRALTDLRLQIRAETHFTEAEDRLIAAVERHAIDYVVFNDHLEEGYRMSRSQPADFAYWARKLRIATEDLQSRMDAARSRARAVPRHLCRLAETFDRLGVSYGSHDDPNGETREFYNMIGARIAEFPLTRAAAAAAHAMGNPVLMGAPNVVRGGSQSGNIAAEDLISEGLCDVLVSDYHMPALPLAAFALADRGVLPLARAWEMISTRPAAVMGLADRGYIAPGLRADLVILHAETRAIEATISGGRLSHLSGEAGHRFLSQSRSTATSHLPLAAE